jgi:serine phosphatase RsbU (regulator of sigma subunit)
MQIATIMGDLSLLLLVPGCFKTKLAEMRWIGAALVFIAFIETNRILGQFDLPSFPQDFMWGSLDFDLRPPAYLLFSIVMLIAMTFRLRRIQDRNREIEQEIAAARSVQQILIPDQLPHVPGLTIESAYLPAQEVGGDFFQILPIPNPAEPGHPAAFIVLGDVSGKGLKAAMTVSLIVGTLRTCAEFCSTPAELLAGLNRRLHGRGDGFATCLALLIEPSGRLTIANAGHLNAYLNGIEIQTEANLPLGLALDLENSQISLELDPHQTCTLVTDGVVEASSASTRELFGFDRTQAISTRSASSIAEAARAFGLGAPQADDITVLTITRTAVPQPALA